MPSPYRAVNTFYLGYKKHPVYAVSGTSCCLQNTSIQCGQKVQLLNVKLVDASRNQKVNLVVFVSRLLMFTVMWGLNCLFVHETHASRNVRMALRRGLSYQDGLV
jgi:hypothetical protein